MSRPMSKNAKMSLSLFVKNTWIFLMNSHLNIPKNI